MGRLIHQLVGAALLLMPTGCASLPPLRTALGDSDLTWARIQVEAVQLSLSCHDAAFGGTGADLGFLRAMENSLNRALGPPGEVGPARKIVEVLELHLDCHVMTADLQNQEESLGEGRAYLEVRVMDHEQNIVALGSIKHTIPQSFMWSPTAAAESIMGELAARLGRTRRIKGGTRWKLGAL